MMQVYGMLERRRTPSLQCRRGRGILFFSSFNLQNVNPLDHFIAGGDDIAAHVVRPPSGPLVGPQDYLSIARIEGSSRWQNRQVDHCQSHGWHTSPRFTGLLCTYCGVATLAFSAQPSGTRVTMPSMDHLSPVYNVSLRYKALFPSLH